jgi:hypothetical protein
MTTTTERIRPDIGSLIRALRNHAFHFGNESELQTGIAAALTAEGIVFEREVVIGDGDRIDFLIGALGAEVKLKVSPNDVIRQVHRYVQAEILEAVIVITSSMRLATSLPESMNGKPVYTYCIAGDAL